MKSKDTNIPKSVIGALMASGFPFQTAIASAIKNTVDWLLENEEYPWQDSVGEDQFLDIIATNSKIHIAVECKKTQKEILTFLIPGTYQSNEIIDVSCISISQRQDSTKDIAIISNNWALEPPSYQSNYCVVSTGDSGKNQRLLERDAQRLLHGMDAFTQKYHKKWRPSRPSEHHLFLPLLVTNAPLFSTFYKPSDISLETGQFIKPPPNIKKVDWVRFTKPFTTLHGHDLGSRTVIVVNAMALTTFLPRLVVRGWIESGISIEKL